MKFNKKSRYFKFTLITLILTLITICIITLFIIWQTNKTTSIDTYNEAIKWQQETKGIISTNSKIANIYKKHYTESIIKNKNIDTIILGSSTLMGLKSDFLKENNIYNSSKNGNTLRNTITEAKYLLKTNNEINHIIISFDLFIGFPFIKYKNINYQKLFEKEKKLSFYKKVKDAISYQRTKIIFVNLINKLLKKNQTYTCPKENNIGSDYFFEPNTPKLCAGFRYDGSATFAHLNSLNEYRYNSYLNNGLNYYINHIITSEGEIENNYLINLQNINDELKKRKGDLYIIIPPLIPKGKMTITKNIKAKKYLKEILDKLTKFTKENKIILLNFSQSEQFDCTYNEFVDGHHALPECWGKILNTESVKKDLQGIKSDTF